MSRRAVEMPISRRVLWTFLSVVVVLCAQLAWWVTFTVRSSHQQTLAALEHLDRDVQLAEAVILRIAQAQGVGPNTTMPEDVIQQFFPDLIWAAVAGPALQAVPRQLTELYPDHQVMIRPEALARVQQGHHAHTRMFIGEGGFFLAMVLVGVTLIFRTLRREVSVMRQQSNFLAAVSHELKSPLASIRLYTETLQLRQVTNATRLRYLGIMRLDVDRLETLVGNLLAVARLDHGDYEARPRRLDMVKEVRTLVGEMAEEMQARGAPVTLHLPAACIMAVVDPAVLATVLRNVLDNAAKYNQHNRGVEVRMYQVAHTLVISIIDQGIGLSPVELSRIFKKFYRVGDELVRQTEGSGLGLYLVQALWRHSGGRVRALSPGPNLGTTVELTLPIEPTQRSGVR